MSAVARAYHSSERVITGRVRSTVATSGMDITSRFWTGGKRGGDAPREMIGRKPFAFENVVEQRGSEPPARKGNRVQTDGDLVSGRDFRHDGRQTANGEVIFDGDD